MGIITPNSFALLFMVIGLGLLELLVKLLEWGASRWRLEAGLGNLDPRATRYDTRSLAP